MHATFQSYAALAGLIFQLIVLAAVLTAVGWYVRKLIYTVLETRLKQKMRSEAVVAGARARAQARVAQRQASF
jgi:hypothetical protein